MEKKLIIKNLERKDLNHVELLQKKNICEIKNIWNNDELNAFISKDGSYSRVAIIENKIIGFSLFFYTSELLEVFLIFVLPDHRRNGVGRKFFSDVFILCKKKMIKRVLLEVNQNNLEAIIFYESMGFKKISVKKNYYQYKGKNFDAFVMEVLI